MSTPAHAGIAVAIGLALAPLLLVALPYMVWCVVVLAAVLGVLP